MLVNYVSFLVAHGMEVEKIRKLSLRQIDALTKVFERRDRNKLIEFAICMRMSQSEGKDWKKFMKELEKSSG